MKRRESASGKKREGEAQSKARTGNVRLWVEEEAEKEPEEAEPSVEAEGAGGGDGVHCERRKRRVRTPARKGFGGREKRKGDILSERKVAPMTRFMAQSGEQGDEEVGQGLGS